MMFALDIPAGQERCPMARKSCTSSLDLFTSFLAAQPKIEVERKLGSEKQGSGKGKSEKQISPPRRRDTEECNIRVGVLGACTPVAHRLHTGRTSTKK
ncbi:hypothetical protein CVU37_05265 [candidate division BRC1 bacterium HGW-BRC1-1]|nr:MAG: hypothetical protein CVU37_05265 [candidate division BRC1 bacterium HGW-BRC1-1]